MLTTTQLASAVTVNDVSVVVASAAGFAPGMPFRIDDEWFQVSKGYVNGLTTIPALRGFDGSATSAHKSGANVTVGLTSDFPSPQAQTMVTAPTQQAWRMYSYSASGAIPATPGIHILNGTSALTMTLGSPSKDLDGQILILLANGKAAHTVTYTTVGFGGGGAASDVATFSASLQGGMIAMASNGVWVQIGTGAVPVTA